MSNLNQVKRMTTEAVSDEMAVATILATAYNHLDASLLNSILASDIELSSVASADVVHGKDEVVAYFEEEFAFYRNEGISIIPQIAEADNASIALVAGRDNQQNPKLLLLYVENAKLHRIFVRYNYMVTFADLQSKDMFKAVFTQAVCKANHWIPEVLASIGVQPHDYQMIQAHPMPNAPADQHISFRVYDTTYSVVLKLMGQYHTAEQGRVLDLVDTTPQQRIEECTRLGMTACELHMDLNMLGTPVLLNTDTGEPVDFKSNKEKKLQS